MNHMADIFPGLGVRGVKIRNLPKVLVALIVATAMVAASTPAQPPEKRTTADKPTDVAVDAATLAATAKALEWLAEKQNANGSWSEIPFPHNTAITSFAMLAFMSQGHLPGQGKFGPQVAKGCRFLLSSARDADGYLIGTRGGNMYAHGMATLALAELWGMTGELDVKPVLQRAVELIIRSQSTEGGWRYDPHPHGADISVTIMQVMALRAAKNSGLHVPDRTLDRAIEYIKRCYDPRTGGYRYQPNQQEIGFARTAAGICVLQLSGKFDAEEIPKALTWLKIQGRGRVEYFWYGLYYAAHAMHQVGGKEWAEWYSRTRDFLLIRQSTNGSWSSQELDNRTAGPVYQTAIAVLVLSVPMQYLPIFQR